MKRYAYLACVAASMAIMAGCGGSSGGGGSDSSGGSGGNGPGTKPDPVKHVFAASDGVNDVQLWITDGTETGTSMVKKINATGGSDPEGFVRLGDHWFFAADDGNNGTELWKTDGTEAGTVMVKDIYPNGSSNPEQLVVAGNTLYFVARDPDFDYTLYKSDGSAENTTRIVDLRPLASDYIESLMAFGSNVYFRAPTADGPGLWMSDGTANGTKRLTDTTGMQPIHPKRFTIFKDSLFFVASDFSRGSELWKLDGETPEIVKDLVGGYGFSSDPQGLTVVGDTLFFSADGAGGRELYKSDGEAAGTVRVKDIYDEVYANGTVASSSPNKLYALDNTLYFSAVSANSGTELWKSDGTEAGTVLVKSIANNLIGSHPEELFQVGGNLLFTAHDGTTRDLWISDGTEAGTLKVMNTTLDNSPSEVVPLQYQKNTLLTVAGGDVLLVVRGGSGIELWKTNGTAAGTAIVRDINEGTGDALSFP